MKVSVLLLAANLALVFGNDLLEFSNSNRVFSSNIYKELAGINSGNFIGCPMSVQLVLSMVHAGARHQTAQQLADGLSLPNNPSKINAMVQAILPKFKSEPNLFSVKTANKMYVAPHLKISEGFKSTAVDVFKAGIENINFADNVHAVEEINEWVAKQTENYIKELLNENDIDGNTQAVLLNALYFQARWDSVFFERSTKKANFHTSKIGSVEVDMMENTNIYRYHQCGRLKAKFLKMAYSGDDLSMVVVLPDDKDGLPQLEANMHDVLQEQNYTLEMVHVQFPKFKMDASIKFVPILKKMGIADLFTPQADLSGITADSAPLLITDVIQKNYIEVNEKGTIAASATAALVGLSGIYSPNPPKEFIAEHPFIYYIQSEAGILFVGRFAGHE